MGLVLIAVPRVPFGFSDASSGSARTVSTVLSDAFGKPTDSQE